MFSTKTLLISAALALLTTPVSAQEFKTDQGHTEVRFGWSHAGISRQHAEFTVAEGLLDLNLEKIEASTLNVTIDASSLSSGFGPLDDHLKAADFLDVAQFPEINFVSTAITRTGETTADVTGDLTIHGVTRSVVMQTTLTHQGPHPLGSVIDYYKGEWLAFSANLEIDHTAFGVGSFNTGPIAISIDTELKASE